MFSAGKMLEERGWETGMSEAFPVGRKQWETEEGRAEENFTFRPRFGPQQIRVTLELKSIWTPSFRKNNYNAVF